MAITNDNASTKAGGLAGYFRHILRAGRTKLWQDMYVLAAARLNVPPGNILHVDDDLEADVTGAIFYGMQACWINDRGGNFAAAADARLYTTSGNFAVGIPNGLVIITINSV